MKKLGRVEFVHAREYDKELNVFVCEACGAAVVGLVKHIQFHERVDKEYWDSEHLLGLVEA